MAPVDVVKAQSVPNTQFKEITRPVNQLSGTYQLTDDVSVGAFYQLQWEETRLPASGSYFSTSDILGEGNERLVVGAPFPAFLGGNPDSPAGDLMYLFLTSHEPENPWMDSATLAEKMRERMQGFTGLIGELREQITDSSQVVYKPMEVVFVNEPWHRGRVLIIGDAAHATTPHLGQGAGMAIEDAVVLSEELTAGGSVQEQLQRFMKRRFERCKYISESSVLAGDKEMQHDREFDRIGLVKQMLARTAEPI